MRAGAAVDAKNGDGDTPLHVAGAADASATAEVLRRYGGREEGEMDWKIRALRIIFSAIAAVWRRMSWRMRALVGVVILIGLFSC